MFASKDLFFSKPSGYQISRSVRLRSSASAYLNRSAPTTSTNTVWTFSAWFKRGKLSADLNLFGAAAASNSYDTIYFNSSDNLTAFEATSGSIVWQLTTSQVFRDPAAWYHLVFAYDSTQATSTNRLKMYINGLQVTAFSTATYPSLNATSYINSSSASLGQFIGRFAGSAAEYFDGYMTEINMVSGQALTPSSFGQTNTVTGVWQPLKYTGTYGTNGFYLNFSDNSNNTATTIGKDYSGNGNNWTPNNISVTNNSTYDSMLDVPTLYADGGNGRGNYAVLNPLNSAMSPTSGNLNLEPTGTSGSYISASTLGISTGKWYYEIVATTYTGTGQAGELGFRLSSASAQTVGTSVGDASGFAFGLSLSSTWYSQKYGAAAVNLTGLTSATTGTIAMIAVDFDAGYAWVGKDGTWYNSGNPATGANPTITGITAGNYVATISAYRDATRNYSFAANFGQRPFSYTPPTGFVALNTQNLPTPTISNGANYMAVTTYTGTGSALTIANTVNGISFQPDFVWVKGRSGATDHALYDSVRGTTKDLVSNSTAAETTQATGLTAFGSTGFTVGALAKMNTNAATYVGWQWLAGTTSSSNTNGSITSTVSVGATQGFSVVTFVNASGTNQATVGHGLGVAPRLIIAKNRDTSANNWAVFHASVCDTTSKFLKLNTTDAIATFSTVWGAALPTSTVFGVTGTGIAAASVNMVAYCFSEVAGYSKFGSYTGNGSADGTFVFCGFRPRWIMVKRTDAVGNWQLLDTSRSTYNVSNANLYPNLSNAEVNGGNEDMDILSNGFKPRNASASFNVNTGTYIFAAFAENPFKNSLAR